MRQLPLLPLLLSLALASSACGDGNALPTTLGPATVASVSPVPEDSPVSPKVARTETPVPTTQSPSFSGLMIAYIREGNLWFWSEANGPYQMTDSGGLTNVCISADGKMLAFVRGAEIWTARTDGTEARKLVTRTVPGGRLMFSPNGLLLAVSDKNQIQLIALTTSAITTALAYPAIAGGYEPEVIWTPDSSGFKTIIPAAIESGQAEFFFVFTTGTAASLAKFAMVSPAESAPFLSPDGGYAIYVAKTADDKKSLYLMDSSGATKPYGEPADVVRAFGWQPDSKHFTFGSENPQRAFMGDVNELPREISLGSYDALRWVNREKFLTLESDNFYLGSVNGGRTQIDSGVSEFDFSH